MVRGRQPGDIDHARMTTDLRVSVDTLDDEDDADLTWRVIAPAYEAVSLSDGPDALARDLASLTPGQRALLAMHWCVAETLNGGFDQFFTNPSGLLADEAIVGFERLGVPELGGILRAAREILATRPAEADTNAAAFDEATEADRFDAYLERYEPLEHEFHVILDGALYPRAAAYVRSHAEEFVR
jgi:hypothetical protein